MSKWFRLEEFLDSSVARQKGISNSPSWEIVERLGMLATFLDDVRDKWGSGIKISSGFRNEKLNAAVGGVKNSNHLWGWCADIQPVNGKLDEFARFLKDYLKDKGFDECIFETKGKTRWIHFALMNANGGQRRKMFNLTVK